MATQSLPSVKSWLLEVWLDIQRCLARRAYDEDDPLTDFEKLVIALEDRRYLRHKGIDYRSIARVLLLQIANRRRGGASTIEMQFVRTVTQRFERTLGRKFREIVTARLLAFHLGKHEILRGYLRLAYFGHQKRGASAAAMRVFGKPLEILSLEESAIVAAMLVYPAPKILPSERWSSKVQKRAQYGLRLLAKTEQC